jgi:hypothetical protein|tara:strand:+ start:526 stop:717 length:192 start_codon:yes stop_codon:yes gene_type:complete
MGLVEGFILLAYIAGTGFGYYIGVERGRRSAIADTIDSLMDQGYLKFKGSVDEPTIMKHDEEN